MKRSRRTRWPRGTERSDTRSCARSAIGFRASIGARIDWRRGSVITAVQGIKVGHWTDPVGLTGCTVVLPPPGTIGSGEVRGGAPGTRETDLLQPGRLVEEVHGVLLTGGSAFGLAAADGVMRWLEGRGVGFDVGVARVPIVPAAVVFDLRVGDPTARPGPAQ